MHITNAASHTCSASSTLWVIEWTIVTRGLVSDLAKQMANAPCVPPIAPVEGGAQREELEGMRYPLEITPHCQGRWTQLVISFQRAARTKLEVEDGQVVLSINQVCCSLVVAE